MYPEKTFSFFSPQEKKKKKKELVVFIYSLLGAEESKLQQCRQAN